MNILLFVNDTLRYDHLSCNGYFRKTSPNMDQLAEEGLAFDDFYSSAVNTGPAFTSIHTGLYPIHHGVYSCSPRDEVLDDIPTLAQELRSGGYTTFAADNLAHNRMWSRDPVHFYRGFEYYVSDVSTPKDWDVQGERTTAQWYNDRLIPWIRSHSSQKFFAFVHYWDVHQPYTQPDEYRRIFRHKKGDRSDLQISHAPAGYDYVPGWGKLDELFEDQVEKRELRSPGTIPRREAGIDLYDGAIAYLDRCIGDVVGALREENILEDTLIISTADHGELLGQHHAYSHINVWDPTIHIPFIMRYPSQLGQGKRVGGYSGQVDILPTLLDLAGLPEDVGADGETLRRLESGTIIREEIVSEADSGSRAIRTGDWKLIHYYQDGKDELHNVRRDPMEVVDLAETEPNKAGEMRRRLADWVQINLGKGRDDPIEYVGRNYDYRGTFDEIRIDSYYHK